MEAKKHDLIPEHLRLSDKEKKQLFEKHSIVQSQLPKIFLSDPAIAHLGVKEGDVVKIVRNSPTSGKIVFYRGVINE